MLMRCNDNNKNFGVAQIQREENETCNRFEEEEE